MTVSMLNGLGFLVVALEVVPAVWFLAIYRGPIIDPVGVMLRAGPCLVLARAAIRLMLLTYSGGYAMISTLSIRGLAPLIQADFIIGFLTAAYAWAVLFAFWWSQKSP